MRILGILPKSTLLMLTGTLMLCLPAAAEQVAGGKVNLVIAGEPGAPLASYQEWARELGRVGLHNVRVRAAMSGDKLDIHTRSEGDYRVYEVTGFILGGGELALPGAKFAQGDAEGVARWVKDLADNGPPQSREPRGPFGLKESSFKKVMADLGREVDFPTQGQSRAEVMKKIAEKLAFPLNVEAVIRQSLARDTVAEELQGLSCGTSLACVLRPLGLGFAPREDGGGRIIYEVLPQEFAAETEDADQKTWPVGWTPQGRRQKVLPELFEFHTISISNVSLAKVLEAVGKKLEVPVLVDRGRLAGKGIDLDKIDVALPAGRTTYGLTLFKILSRSKLKYELMVDEAGQAFVWVTVLRG